VGLHTSHVCAERERARPPSSMWERPTSLPFCVSSANKGVGHRNHAPYASSDTHATSHGSRIGGSSDATTAVETQYGRASILRQPFVACRSEQNQVQRPFPGTYPRLDFLSNRECRACFTVSGGFVCNYEGSGACGPLQFKSGTFYGHMPAARAYVKALGYRVPEKVWDWRNPLGQALVGAHMHYTKIDGCHWCL